MRSLPPTEYLRDCLEYDPTTGIFIWKTRPKEHFCLQRICSGWNTQYAGKIAGIDSRGYTTIRINNFNFRAHRLAWKLSTGDDPIDTIDHINGDKSDNRIGNLRQASQAEQTRNVGMKRANTSGYRGIYKLKSGNFFARITSHGVQRNLGTFTSAEAASAVYETASSQSPR